MLPLQLFAKLSYSTPTYDEKIKFMFFTARQFILLTLEGHVSANIVTLN